MLNASNMQNTNYMPDNFPKNDSPRSMLSTLVTLNTVQHTKESRLRHTYVL